MAKWPGYIKIGKIRFKKGQMFFDMRVTKMGVVYLFFKAVYWKWQSLLK